MSHLFTRDGHLRDAAIDAALRGDLVQSDQAALEAHADACVACNARIAWMRADFADAEAARTAAIHLSPPAEPPARWVSTAVAASLAGIVLVNGLWWFAHPAKTVPGASGLVLEVVRQPDGARLEAGAQVRGGDRIGFRVASSTEGYLVIVGVDDDGSTYPGFPSANDLAAWIGATSVTVPLDAAVDIEGTAQSERLVAVRCPTAFEVGDIVNALTAAHDQPVLPTLREGCAQTDVTLAEVER